MISQKSPEDQLNFALTPFFKYDCNREGGSFRVWDIHGWTKSIVLIADTIAHELGHLFSLPPLGPEILHSATLADPLVSYIGWLPVDEQIHSEVFARAINLLVAQELGRNSTWVNFWKHGREPDHKRLRSGAVAELAGEERTQRIARKILRIVLDAGVDLQADQRCNTPDLESDLDRMQRYFDGRSVK